MDKFKKLLDRCKCGVYLTVNEHRDYYQSVGTRLEELGYGEDDLDITSDVLKKMIELDTLVALQFYPDTPIGFYVIYHWDVEQALDEALSIIQNDKN